MKVTVCRPAIARDLSPRDARQTFAHVRAEREKARKARAEARKAARA